jgi:hemin uptake protein HemP
MSKTDDRTSEGVPASRGSAALSDMASPVEPAPVPRVESTTLFQLGREVVIVHNGQEYRLRITKSDKLILTK